MPYDKKLGKMVWTKEDKIRAIVYLTVMISIFIGMMYIFSVKLDNAIESGVITESDLEVATNMLEARVMFLVVAMFVFMVAANILIWWSNRKKKPLEGR